jgi:hypothetical protein
VRRAVIAGLLAASACAALVVAAPASARVVVNRSIAGVRIGMSPDAVRGAVGRPSHAAGRVWRYEGRKLVVRFGDGKRVTSVWTRSRRQRTARGVGVGSTKATVRRRVPGIRCKGASDAYCVVPASHGAVTTFALGGRRVTVVILSTFSSP